MIKQTIESLNKKSFIAKLIPRQSLLDELCEIIPKDSKIGCGGSITLEELHIMQDLQSVGYNTLSTSTSTVDWETQCKQNRNADFYFTSVNAISMDGYLVNIDGRGNRVANTIYGVDNVVVICGTNKITKDLNSAIDRARNIAAPKNCMRLKKNTPCVKTGKCMDCQSTERICRSFVVHAYPNSKTNMYVFLIDEKLGF